MSRKPRVLMAGEFSAGKTRLISALLDADVLPSNVTATALPPVWLTHGAEAMMQVDLDGHAKPIAELPQIGPDDDTTFFCLKRTPNAALENFDVIDTPGNSDPNMAAECWERVVPFADMIIWCSNATQAWRQSEKAVWDDMPEEWREKAVLLITHADRLPDDTARARVMKRVSREASEYFSDIWMASLVDQNDVTELKAKLSAKLDVIGLTGGRSQAHEEFMGAGNVAQLHSVGPARALWNELAVGMDLNNPADLRACVERFIVTLDETLQKAEADHTEGYEPSELTKTYAGTSL